MRLVALACGLVACAHQAPPTPVQEKPPVAEPVAPAFVYPSTRTVDQVDDYHGTKVADPYRWLEDLDSPETAAWVEAQNKLTFGFLEKIPERAAIKARISKLWDFEKYGVPYREGGRYFWSKIDGLQNQAVVYTTTDLAKDPAVLLDPNLLAADGTVAYQGGAVDDAGKLFAYKLAASGSDWNTIRVRDVATAKDLADELKWVKFSSLAWSKDGKGFYYNRYDEPKPGQELEDANYYQKLYYHRVGEPQDKDVLVYERKDEKTWSFGAGVTDDGKYLVLHVGKGTDAKYQIFYQRLGKPGAKMEELIVGFANEYSFITNVGDKFYFKTDLDAERGRVIQIDLAKPDRKNWKEIIPQREETLEGVEAVGGKLIAKYLKDAHALVVVHDLAGKHLADVKLPGLGTIMGFGGKLTDEETFFVYTDYTTPSAVYRYDVKNNTSELFKAPTVDFDPAAYETEQVFFSSKDGTRVPMFIVHKKGLEKNGKNPTILYGYGGFNVPLTPGFGVSTLVWLEMGGVYAVANLRGGGEYGEAWHKAGTRAKKQNVFDDFFAAAEYLKSSGWTSTEKLAIMGGSNGGLLVGAAMTQHPEMFGAALPAVGVMDMLRFHKFTIGWAWIDDYGSSDDAEEFKTLLAYSPYHNLKKGTKYPPTLVTTADHDDRVVPSHSFKFASALQAAQGGDAPVLIRIDVKAGHGAGKPTGKVIEQYADMWAFLVATLGMTPTL